MSLPTLIDYNMPSQNMTEMLPNIITDLIGFKTRCFCGASLVLWYKGEHTNVSAL